MLMVGHGRGVFVRSPDTRGRATGPERESLRTRFRELFADARLLGLSNSQTREFVLAELERFHRQEKRS